MDTMQHESNTSSNGRRKLAWSVAGLILLIPFIAMQFTDEVAWSVGDFVLFGAMMAGSLLAYEVATKKTHSGPYKKAVSLALIGAFLIVWINGAVGIIGSENNDANLIFDGVLAIGLIGVLLSRFQPLGMSRAMYAMAAAQFIAFVIAWSAGWGFTGPFTLAFMGIWLISARLFQKAARQS